MFLLLVEWHLIQPSARAYVIYLEKKRESGVYFRFLNSFTPSKSHTNSKPSSMSLRTSNVLCSCAREILYETASRNVLQSFANSF
jgi:hypothetical protein